MATRAKLFRLLVGQAGFRVQFIEVPFVELPRDGFVDAGDRGVVPEPRIFLHGIETIDRSGAGDMRLTNLIEKPRHGPTM